VSDRAAPIGMVFIGCGGVTALHSRTLRSILPEVRRYYASRAAARAAAFEREHHGAGSFGSYEAALADERSSVALIATPPALHLPLTLQALERGKHVIVEKPAFLDVGELDRAAGLAQRVGRQVLVAENYYYRRLTSELRRIIGSGALGDVLFVNVNALKRQRTGDWRDDAALAGGGALFEGGIHWISLLGNIGLTITRVHIVHAGAHETRPSRSAAVAIEYAEGAAGVLVYSWDVHSPLQGLRISRISGTRNTVTFESNGLFLAVGARVRPLPGGLRDLRGFRAMFRDFFEALRTGRAPQFTLELARRDIELLTAASTAAVSTARTSTT
jgi:UDP-N-acetylglucosamine 3-dehydrogenase